MKKRPIQWNVRQIAKMINQSKSMRLDHHLQRAPGQWKKDAPSKLVDSLFTMFVPYFIVLQKDNPDYDEVTNPKAPKYIYWVLDGVQRTTYLTSFIDLVNGWTLDKTLNHKKKEDGTFYEVPVWFDGCIEEECLAGKKFADLSEEAQQHILNYSLTFQILELEEGDDEEEEIKRVFDRINSGAPVSKAHHSFNAADTETKLFVTEQVDNHKLFTDVAHFSPTDVKNTVMELSVIQNLILVSGHFWEDMSNDSITKVVSNSKFLPEHYEKLKKAYDMLSTVEFTKPKFLSKNMLVSFVNLLIHNDFNEEALKFFLWYEQNAKPHDSFKGYLKGATTKKSSIQGRTMALQNMFEEFLKQQEKNKGSA